jgi:hypothetical protein
MRDEVLYTLKEKKNILCTTQRRKANWIGHILYRKWLIIHTEGKKEASTEMM